MTQIIFGIVNRKINKYQSSISQVCSLENLGYSIFNWYYSNDKTLRASKAVKKQIVLNTVKQLS